MVDLGEGRVTQKVAQTKNSAGERFQKKKSGQNRNPYGQAIFPHRMFVKMGIPNGHIIIIKGWIRNPYPKLTHPTNRHPFTARYVIRIVRGRVFSTDISGFGVFKHSDSSVAWTSSENTATDS